MVALFSQPLEHPVSLQNETPYVSTRSSKQGVRSDPKRRVARGAGWIDRWESAPLAWTCWPYVATCLCHRVENRAWRRAHSRITALDHMSDATQHHGLGWGGVGMMTFCALDHMSDATQHHGLGWGGDDDVLCTWPHVGCHATSWVGVGWGGDDDVLCTWPHVGCYATSWVGVGWGGDDDVLCTWPHVGCYATSWVGVGWGGDDDVLCTWPHVGCYHIPKSLGSQSKQVPLRIRSWQWRFTHADHSDLFSLCGTQVAKMWKEKPASKISTPL